jgi:hypothetical protein
LTPIFFPVRVNNDNIASPLESMLVMEPQLHPALAEIVGESFSNISPGPSLLK